jgi:hypothetical protein
MRLNVSPYASAVSEESHLRASFIKEVKQLSALNDRQPLSRAGE